MRSATSKTTRKLQLDLPLDQACVDPSSVHSVSPVPRTEATPDATPIAGQPDRPISFHTKHERVVATFPEERSRETKLPAGINTDTNRNLYRSLGRTEQDAVSGTKLPLHSLTGILEILRHLDAAQARPEGTDTNAHPAHGRGPGSADSARGSGDRSSDSVAPCAPGTSNPSYEIATNDRPR